MSSVRQETLQNLRFVIGERKDKDISYKTQFDRYIERLLTYFNGCNTYNSTYLNDMETSFGENLITSFKAGIK